MKRSALWVILLLFFSINGFCNAPAIEPKVKNGQNASDKQANPRGQMLYENHCRVCHNSIVHIRENRKVKKLSDIYYWANRWSNHLKLSWTKEDLDEVVKFLNKKFYTLSK